MTDSVLAFERLLQVASGRSPDLHAALLRVGAVEVSRNAERTVAHHLYLSVVSQQLSVKAADTIWGRIVAAAAERGGPPQAFFVPGHEEMIRTCGLSRNKIKALQAVREAECQGMLDDALLASLAHAERSVVLKGIWGIGQWTADMIGIFHFLDPDIWPDGDVAARGMLKKLAACDDTVAEAAHFAPYRSLLARAMWRARDAVPISAETA